jgi:hypothetical protein
MDLMDTGDTVQPQRLCLQGSTQAPHHQTTRPTETFSGELQLPCGFNSDHLPNSHLLQYYSGYLSQLNSGPPQATSHLQPHPLYFHPPSGMYTPEPEFLTVPSSEDQTETFDHPNLPTPEHSRSQPSVFFVPTRSSRKRRAPHVSKDLRLTYSAAILVFCVFLTRVSPRLNLLTK